MATRTARTRRGFTRARRWWWWWRPGRPWRCPFRYHDGVRTIATLGWSLLLVVPVFLAGCARSHLFYDARELRHAPLQKDQARALDQFVVDKLAGRSVTWVDGSGREQVVAAADVPKKLGLAEKGALWLTLNSGEVGGENDVRVRIGKRSTPISVYIALDGAIRVVTGERDVDEGEAPSMREIQERFGLDGKLVGKWEDAERRALAQALASLTPAELEVVRDIHFDRQGAPRNKDPSRAAVYEMRGCRALIFVFSSSVRADAFRFVGNATEPRSAVLHSIVHEIGHAFEQHAARSKLCAAEKTKNVAKANELVVEGSALSEASPVLTAYLAVLSGEPAPTDYGNESAHESFAESFALFHVDPDALRRTRPKVFDWFARGGHLRP